MPWELYTRERVARGNPTVTITAMGRLALNKTATATFEKLKVTHVQLLWNNEAHAVAVRPSEAVKGSYQLMFGTNGNGAGFSSVTFLNHIEYDWMVTRSFDLTWDEQEGFFVFTIPLEHLGKPVPAGFKGGYAKRAKPADSIGKEKEAAEATP